MAEHANKRKKSDLKQKAEDEKKFLAEQAKRQRKCDKKQKAKDAKSFLKAQRVKRQKCDEKKKESVDAAERLKKFKRSTRFGPIFVCRCCERKLFEHQVTEVDMENFKEVVEENEPGLFSVCIDSYSKSNVPKLSM